MLLRRRYILVCSWCSCMLWYVFPANNLFSGKSDGFTGGMPRVKGTVWRHDCHQVKWNRARTEHIQNSKTKWQKIAALVEKITLWGCLFSKTKSGKKINLVSAVPLSELITDWVERGASFARCEQVFQCSGWKQNYVLVFWEAPCWEQIGRESCAAQREGFVFLVNHLKSCW